MAIDDNTSYELTGYQVKDLAQKIRAKADASAISAVGYSNLYSDLTGTPTIPTVYNGTLTVTQGGNTLGTFTANSSADVTIDVPAGGSSYTAGTGIDITNNVISFDSSIVTHGQIEFENAGPGGSSVYWTENSNDQTTVVTLPVYGPFTGATSSAAGVAGLVPAPATSDPDKFLKGDGTWATPTDTTYTAGTNVQISAQNVISATDTTYSAFAGATSSAAGTSGLVPAPAAGDEGKALHGDGTWKDTTAKLVEMSYGESNAWAKFIAAYNAGSIVYCRASSNANPATGSQTRKAFMAYVNNAASPTNVEFQYVRSQSSKTDSQQTDQVFVYTLTNASGGTWSVASRNMGPKINVSGPITKTFTSGANATITIGADAMTGATASAAGTAGIVPAPAAGDNTKFLRGDGIWATAGGGGASIPTVYLSDNGSLFRGSFANLLFPNNGFVLSATPISYTAGSNTAISEGDMIALLQSGCPIRVEGSIAQDGYASGCTGLITCSSTGAGAKFRLEFLGSNQYFAGTASVNSIDGTTGGVRWGWQQ